MKSRQTEVLTSRPISVRGTPDSASAFSPASAAASATGMGPPQTRRSRMPATSSSSPGRIPRRSSVDCRRTMSSAEVNRTGASTCTTAATLTFS